MAASTATFTLPPNILPFSSSLQEFRKSYDSAAGLIIGAFIFSYGQPVAASLESNVKENLKKTTPEPRLLLLHRASADSYGDLWDFPGGSVEENDLNIIDAVKREVEEETGLHVSEIVAYVGMHTWIKNLPGRGDRWAKFSFIVKVTEESDGDHPVIKLAEKEHQNFMWAVEEDIIASLEGRDGALKFIAIEEIEIAAEAFKQFKAIHR